MTQRGASNEYPQHMVSWRDKKIIYTSFTAGISLESDPNCLLADFTGSSLSQGQQWTSSTHLQIRHFFQTKIVDIFLNSLLKHRLWVLIKSSSLRRFLWYLKHMFLWRNKKKIFSWYPSYLELWWTDTQASKALSDCINTQAVLGIYSSTFCNCS